jgi:hypothetical protein
MAAIGRNGPAFRGVRDTGCARRRANTKKAVREHDLGAVEHGAYEIERQFRE